MDTYSINEKIKRIRSNRNMTLRTLAQKSGLTIGYLSRIENSQTAPPLTTLGRIAQALSIDTSYFFVDQVNADKKSCHIVVDRKSAATEGEFLSAFDQQGQQYHYRPLFLEKKGRNLQPFMVIPDFELGPVQRGQGEALIYVIGGSMEFVYGDEKYVFSQGDSCYFDTQIPFTARSLGKKRAKLFVVHYPYRRS